MAIDPKAVVRRYFGEFWTEGRLDVLDQIAAPDVVGHDGGNPAIEGMEAGKAYVRGMRAAFPDMAFQITHQIAEGDLVATRWVCTATHQGEFRGVPATGKTVSVNGIHLHRVREGKIVEPWANWDRVAMLQQLGVLSAAR